MRPDFRRCEAAAKQLLLQQTLTSAWIDVRALQFDKTVLFDSFQHYCELTGMSPGTGPASLRDGCTLIRGTTHLVLYHDGERKRDRLNFTLAHEVGHIYLGHRTDGDIQEVEANFFAAELLMPESVVRYMIRRNHGARAEDLHEWFYVTLTAAQKRLQTLRRKGGFSPTAADREILRRFLPYLSADDPPVFA